MKAINCSFIKITENITELFSPFKKYSRVQSAFVGRLETELANYLWTLLAPLGLLFSSTFLRRLSISPRHATWPPGGFTAISVADGLSITIIGVDLKFVDDGHKKIS